MTYTQEEAEKLVVNLTNAILSDMAAELGAPTPETKAARTTLIAALTGGVGGEPIALTYTNYRGETAERTITPKRVWFGSTEWHPKPQWLLEAFDHEKNANRDFALKDFGSTLSQPEPQPETDIEAIAKAIHAMVTEWYGNMVLPKPHIPQELIAKRLGRFAALPADGGK